jgi:hypothetical protein
MRKIEPLAVRLMLVVRAAVARGRAVATSY